MRTGKELAFTLIELMIVVAIIAIIAAIAFPSYTQYKVRANRADVQTELMQIAQHLQSYHVINHNYTNTKLDNGALKKDFPQLSSVYEIELMASERSYTLIAKPKTGTIQADNGDVIINNQGWKCWVKSATPCVPTATSSWDGR